MINAKHGGLKKALRYVNDKQKILDWLGIVPPKGTASLTDQELSATKIIEEFENPSIPKGKVGKYLDWDKPISDKQADIIKEALLNNEEFMSSSRKEYDDFKASHPDSKMPPSLFICLHLSSFYDQDKVIKIFQNI